MIRKNILTNLYSTQIVSFLFFMAICGNLSYANSIVPTPTPTPPPDACCTKAEQNFGWDRDGFSEIEVFAMLLNTFGVLCVNSINNLNNDLQQWSDYPSPYDCTYNLDTIGKRNAARHIAWQCSLEQSTLYNSPCNAQAGTAPYWARLMGDAHEVTGYSGSGSTGSSCGDTYADLTNNRWTETNIWPYSDGFSCKSLVCSAASSSDLGVWSSPTPSPQDCLGY